ncbi:MAG: threonine--tRNA ligase [Limnospira sp. PMC 1291.21]|uniref:Threonine--tRNA ligase n=4 Tax=Oscillatoriales TaxID=1150 RepID=A0A9P1NYA5_9CYAN|nr:MULTISPECIES: threonine--tRNA ligase [Limnospira]AMW30571.1 threonine--tRNA ligase [Arthrospira platensis YZ]EKD05947.1 threonyl-tRNA synthetase [Arthrospira platensis C1]MDY7051905.1 threonine--tRNA ligase [Limnospira fusiformis LS22]QJB26908.1 threonine--tRNA ligase [Limnospira fusiformis SAG 85.79]SMN23023.1 Threonine--tRNA ligase [Arthrospira sp. SRM16]
MAIENSQATSEQPQKIHLPKTSQSDQLKRIRHTTSHVMAMAVHKLFPKAQVTIGPWIENGFYYDFDSPEPFTEQDLKAIKKEMVKILKRKLPVIREEVSREEAQRRIETLGEPYKLEILADLTEPITIYHLGDQWWDLCAGPHVETTGDINPKAIELESVAGAYWRGDETKAQLQRIYGTAWETPEQLAEYKRRKEEALRRDHRRLGKELGLFIFSDQVGPGLPLWTPKGTILRTTLEDFLKREQVRRGYQPVVTPHLGRVNLFKTSGHWQKYREDLFPMMGESEDEGFVLKAMNCPFHVQIYKSSLRSYRELPIRLAEFGTVYRYEQSGELGGLTRVRGFTQDDAHLFVTPEQLDDEFLKVVDLIQSVLKKLKLDQSFKARLSFRDPNSDKYIGSDQAWEKAENAIRRAVETLGMNYFEGIGEAAFYGPKLDFIVQDALEREWQLGTVQVDYNLPERFDLEYVAEDGTRQRPVMIHRAPFGSLERLIGILIEEYTGDFPLWLAPVMVRLLPVSDEFFPFVESVAEKWRSLDIRAEADHSHDRLGKMIRNAEKAKVPVMAVVGAKEVESNSLSIRTRALGELGTLTVAETQSRLQFALANFADF